MTIRTKMMQVKLPFVVLAVAALTGCAPMGPIKPATPYVASAHDYYRGKGSNTVTGQAFLRQRGGGLVTCAGTTAAVFPATNYFREVVEIFRMGRTVQREAPQPSAPGSPVKDAICDAQGNFAIEGVPAGHWILTALVQWRVGYDNQGGLLTREIEVKDGSANRFILSDADRR